LEIKKSTNLTSRTFNAIVIVAALGYFVDIYDLTLFLIVRKPSLQALGIQGDDLLKQGLLLLNIQNLGMVIGGIIWGIWGDKKGRLSVLFFTILLYSLANIANAYVVNITQYAIMRFIAGLGLAGELGVGITLVSEVMTTRHRGYGTSIVGGIGILGAVLGFSVADKFDWKVAYLVGGGLGLLLLILRLLVAESGMFEKIKAQAVSKGNFLSLFTNKKRFLKYIYCILLGVPVWYVIGLLINNAGEFAQKVFHITGEIVSAQAVMYHYIGASIGSIGWSLIGQWTHSRKKSLWLAMAVLVTFTALYFMSFGASPLLFYTIVFFLGIAQGYWIIFVTVASEQFGTNLRATVTTTAPNFVRGSTIPVALLFQFLAVNMKWGLWQGALYTGILCIGLSIFALYKLDETYGKDLDYTES
jgi:putative MFS transporter